MRIGEQNKSDTLAPWHAVLLCGIVGLAMGAGFGPVSAVIGLILGAFTGGVLVKADQFRDKKR